ncbi:hypothetical protein [Halorubellus salinus]|uniref:hypothetical protein n=1 Tax=Halorubellus salinus TaxID=755309 RepID=UPI001D077682|nr:hypothetical protein [Halorubellus salinus]
MFPLQVAFGFDALALAVIALVALVVVVLLVRVAVAIAIRVGIVAAIVLGILYALDVTLGIDPLGLPGTTFVDAASLLA